MYTEEKLSPLLDRLSGPVSSLGLERGPRTLQHSAQAVRICHNGFVITSRRKLKIGSVLSLRLYIPPDVSGGPFWECRLTYGRVAKEQALKNGGCGYKVEIESNT